MVGLPCLVSQCAELRVAGWMWSGSTRVYLESCTWLLAIFAIDQWKEQRVYIIFCANLGKSATETQWFNKTSGTKSLVVCKCLNGMPGSRPVAHQWTMTNTQGDPQAAQYLRGLHEFKNSSVRIKVGPFTTLLRRWELVIGHANGFWRKNWTCILSQLHMITPVSLFRPHPAVFGEIHNGCNFPPTVLPWFGTLRLLPISKNEIEAEITTVWYHWGDPGRIAECFILWQKMTSRKRSKNGGDGGTGVYTREVTTSRVMAAEKPYGEFYDFYSGSPEYFGYHHVC
jgi:hypothetical protein